VQCIETLEPVAEPLKVELRRETRWLFDFGQNMVGRVRLKVEGEAGTTLILRHGEILDEEGCIYTENLRTAKATDRYTLSGDGVEVYEPYFTFHGFRYVEVAGYPGTPPRDLLTGIVLHSDIPPIGDFECSDPLLNQLQRNIRWGQKGNFLDVPTDCPQRDERVGWTGDAQVFIRTAAFNMQVGGFFTKWLQDLLDVQSENGSFPITAPLPEKRNGDGGPAWSDAGVICPWTIYLAYGDRRMLEEYYDSMVAFMDNLVGTSKGLIRCHPDVEGIWHGFGDWLSINAETPKDLIGTAFYAYSAGLMAQIAEALDKREDVHKYEKLRENIKQAFIQRFVSADGVVAGETQTAYILALYFDLLPDELRPVAVEALVADIEGRDMHLSTGFVGTPYLLHALSENGRLDVAYQLLMQKSWPSWLYPVTQGATTIWERWDGWTEDKGFQDPAMNSFNHYAYGSVGHWLYSVVAGIELDPAQPGYKHAILRPQPGDGLSHAKAGLESPYGRIESDWKIADGVFHWAISVPPNTTATAYVPALENAQVQESGKPAEEAEGVEFVRREDGAAVYRLISGQYTFTCKYLA
jgi:alpha-L-rhamnosidase